MEGLSQIPKRFKKKEDSMKTGRPDFFADFPETELPKPEKSIVVKKSSRVKDISVEAKKKDAFKLELNVASSKKIYNFENDPIFQSRRDDEARKKKIKEAGDRFLVKASELNKAKEKEAKPLGFADEDETIKNEEKKEEDKEMKGSSEKPIVEDIDTTGQKKEALSVEELKNSIKSNHILNQNFERFSEKSTEIKRIITENLKLNNPALTPDQQKRISSYFESKNFRELYTFMEAMKKEEIFSLAEKKAGLLKEIEASGMDFKRADKRREQLEKQLGLVMDLKDVDNQQTKEKISLVVSTNPV